MINYDEARRIAAQFIRNIRSSVSSSHFVIIESDVREETFGWVFPWNDKRYVETGDIDYTLAGNLPVVVLRKNGQVMYLPAASPLSPLFDVDARIAAFAATLSA